jgi:trans-aconitate methyltransferase
VQADLSTWTPSPNSFDVVIANRVLMDIPDFEPALKNCVAALTSQGTLILSLLHPCFEEAGSAWKEKGEVSVRDYFRERAAKQTYGYFISRAASLAPPFPQVANPIEVIYWQYRMVILAHGSTKAGRRSAKTLRSQ